MKKLNRELRELSGSLRRSAGVSLDHVPARGRIAGGELLESVINHPEDRATFISLYDILVS